MTIVTPAARAPIVTPATGVMTSPMQRAMQALCDAANANIYSAVVPAGAEFAIDGIGADRSFIRIAFDLVPTADGVALHLLGRTGAGVDVAAYSWAWPYNNAASTAAAATNTSDSKIILADVVQDDANTGGVHGEITISNIQSSRYKRVGGWCAHFDGNRERFTGVAGRIDTTSPLTGFRLAFSSGSIASGFARVDAP